MRHSYEPDTRLQRLNGVRAASILLVLAGHLLPLGPKWLGMNVVAATGGMSLFVCLSGFLIVWILHHDPDWKSFLIRRLARIVPSAIVFGLVVYLIYGSDVQRVLAIMFFYANYLDSYTDPATSHMWSLSVEMHFYIAIAVIVAVFGRSGLIAVPLGVLLVLGIKLYLGEAGTIRTHIRVDDILVGGCLALIWINRHGPGYQTLIGYLKYLFWPSLILLAMSCNPNFRELVYLRPFFALMFVGSILFMDDDWRTLIATSRALAYIAAISFALYVWHKLLAQGWFADRSGLSAVEFYLTKRPLSIFLAFVVAHIATFTYEEYVRKMARDYLRRKEPAVAEGRT